MKKTLFALLFIGCLYASAQADERISTLQFVQIIDERVDEALYYYKNNWRSLRKIAVKEKIIVSFEFIRTERTVDYPIDLVLVTTYKNEKQFENREKNFEKVMVNMELDLMNELKPDEFRKTLFVKERSTHSFE